MAEPVRGIRVEELTADEQILSSEVGEPDSDEWSDQWRRMTAALELEEEIVIAGTERTAGAGRG